jgi:branched-chain amino acid transport system substrate-binding protein
MQTSGRWRALGVVLAACALAAGCGRDDDEGGGGGESAGGGGNTTGVTQESIKLGTTFPLSGPASAYATIARAAQARFEFVNSKGGVNGRQIEFEILDDAYEPPRAVTNVRRLVTQEKVFAVFNPLGTPNNIAIREYLNQQEVPQVFVATGAPEFGDDVKEFPWTIGWQPTYRTEAEAMVDYLSNENPDAKIGLLYQNDDFGKAFLDTIREEIQGTEIQLAAQESYEVTDPTVAPQVRQLLGADPDTIIQATTPKPAAQAIGAIAQSGFKPETWMISNVAASESLVFKPVGVQAARGILAPNYLKDPGGAEFTNDPQTQEYRDGIKRFAPRADPEEPFNAYGWAVAGTMIAALEKAGQDLSRESFMEAVRSLDVEQPLFIEGVRVRTGPDDPFPIETVQIQQYNGNAWEPRGDIFSSGADEQAGQ